MRGLTHRGCLIQPTACRVKRSSVELRSKSRPTVLHTVLMKCMLGRLLRCILLDRLESDALVMWLTHAAANGLIELLIHFLINLYLTLSTQLSSLNRFIRGHCCSILSVSNLIRLLLKDRCCGFVIEETAFSELTRVERRLGWWWYKLRFGLRRLQAKSFL